MRFLGRFPSYDFLYKAAVQAAIRFPFTLLSALVGAVSAVSLIGHETDPSRFITLRILSLAALGLPLFTALVAYAENKKWKRGATLVLQVGGLLLILLYFVTQPRDLTQHFGDGVRLLLLVIVCHFLVAFLPYLSGDRVQGFWQYNKSLFLRFLTSALFSAVMFVGLAIALAALDLLFGVDVKPEMYFKLWAIIAIFFNTWVFLSGVPDNLSSLDDVAEYPRGLKIFAQFILLPLVGLYLVILYVYGAKIIVQWNWPKGWVSELILWYSVVGILSLLLLWPLRQLAENKWVRTFANWFFRLLIPLVVMLFFAVLERTSEYGITVNRYLVIAMAVGLAVVVLYFVISKKKDIRSIPMVICLIALLAAYGPWSALHVSQSSQANRLDGFLSKYKLTAGQLVDTTGGAITDADRNEMSSIVMYLNDWHGASAFSRWLLDSNLAPLDTMGRYSGVNDSLCHLLGFDFTYPRFVSEQGTYFSVTARSDDVLAIADYDYLAFLKPRWEFTKGDSTTTVPLGTDTCRIWMSTTLDRILKLNFRSGAADTSEWLEIALSDSLSNLKKRGGEVSMPRDSLTLTASSRNYDISIVLQQVSGTAYPESLRVNYVEGLLLFRKR